MTDIVERLRNYIHGENDDEVPLRIAEAAAEIERLRKALEEIAELSVHSYRAGDIARKALAALVGERP